MQDRTPLLMPRREMLARCGVGFGAAALHAMLQEEPAMGANPLLPKQPHFPGQSLPFKHRIRRGVVNVIRMIRSHRNLRNIVWRDVPA